MRRKPPEPPPARSAPAGATSATPYLNPETAVIVGRVLAPQGLRGEVKVESLSDFPERFAPDAVLWLRGEPVRIEASRFQGRTLVLKIEGVGDRTAAEGLRGAEFTAAPIADLGEGTYYRDDLVGMKVTDEQGQALGELAEIFSTGSNDVYVVRGALGELLLPATDDVIKSIDVAARKIVVDVVEGLEWVARASGRARRPAKGN